MQSIFNVTYKSNQGETYSIDNPSYVKIPKPFGVCEATNAHLSQHLYIGVKTAHFVKDIRLELHTPSMLAIYIPNRHQKISANFSTQTHEHSHHHRSDSMNMLLLREFSDYLMQAGDITQAEMIISREALDTALQMTQIKIDKKLQAFLSGDHFVSEMRHIPLTVEAKQAIQQIQQFPYEDEGLQRLYMEAKAQEWLVHFLAGLNQAKVDKALHIAFSHVDKQRIYEARDRLLANLKITPSLIELAHSVGINEKKLTEGFKIFFGKPVFAWLREQRMLQASELLAEKRLTIQEITTYCGYKYQSDFTKAFKKHFGITPLVFKKSA
ncbi:AraC family transcriptional regulator [Candidatus Albibeggiatoa sp. nov. BB20]|uniref:helix-turn-helix domain-containing protein n=1 Tax=Candidatus Albibeggiatoa sp. nov. BB20 TaxID=3162723 RepID=UPI0033657212